MINLQETFFIDGKKTKKFLIINVVITIKIEIIQLTRVSFQKKDKPINIDHKIFIMSISYKIFCFKSTNKSKIFTDFNKVIR